ncbi:MAG TPA: metallophosphoesterase family protein [Anaerolineales bacterium]|nr:metallophosphoesterase family protein [Anaerolineales bacterium]
MTRQRIAIMADIHGNPIALNAVLADIASHGGVEQYWLLGDYVALGFDPRGVLARLKELQGASFIRGNTDRYVTEGHLPFPSLEEALEHPELLHRHIRIARSFAWTAGAVSAGNTRGKDDYLAWLSALPLEMRTVLPDGTRVLAVHAAPGEDDGDGLYPVMSAQEMEASVASCEADLLLVGHTHVPFERQAGKVQVVNPGSVSNPMAPDLRASYAIIDAKPSGYSLAFRRVDFDRQACIEAAKEVRQPSWKYIEQFMLGNRRPDWESKAKQG